MQTADRLPNGQRFVEPGSAAVFVLERLEAGNRLGEELSLGGTDACLEPPRLRGVGLESRSEPPIDRIGALGHDAGLLGHGREGTDSCEAGGGGKNHSTDRHHRPPLPEAPH